MPRSARSRRKQRDGWSIPLSEPIELKDGSTLVTLGDAAKYVSELAKKGPRMGWNSLAAELMAAWEHPTPANIESVTGRAMAALYFNRLRNLKGRPS